MVDILKDFKCIVVVVLIYVGGFKKLGVNIVVVN